MRNVTLALAALALLLAPEAMAQCTGTPGVDFQQVSVSEINQLPQANIDQLNAAGAGLTTEQIQDLVTNDLEGELVEFQAVVLTNPILSGLASLNDGIPGRIHVFVRDTTALSQGPAGMDIQIVDDRADRVETQNLFVGDEIVVCGLVAPFGSTGRTMQINPVSVSLAGTPVVDLSANPEFDDPIEVEIELQGDSFVIVEVEGEAGDVYAALLPEFVPFAHTNPFFLDADGDGHWTPPGLSPP